MNRVVKTTDPKGQTTPLGYEARSGGGNCGWRSKRGQSLPVDIARCAGRVWAGQGQRGWSVLDHLTM
jgi:hypothetical protein